MRITRGAPWLLLAAALGLAGCASRPVSAPVVNLTPTPGAAAAPQGYYTVKPGDTLYSIALEHGVDYHDLASWNKLEDPTKIRVGQLLRVAPPPPPGVQVGAAAGAGAVEAQPLGGGATGAAPAAAQPVAPGATVTSPKALRLPYSEQNLALLSKQSSQGTTAAPATQTAQTPPAAAPPQVAKAAPAPSAEPVPAPSGPVKFIWPAQGKLIAGFSEANNKGIDIGGKLGEPVLAAAPGRVMYTGSGIRGYGKLIVIKHADGFNSVYAHNKTILVKEGQNVARGQEIGEIGDTEADTPMLHFEIRKSGKPVDPLKYLPAGQRQ
jgi:lipoprotein NlpD